MRDDTAGGRAATSLLLTGASGALGRALALYHAAPGVSMSLWGRDRARLTATAEAARSAGAGVSQRILDLGDGEAAIAALLNEDRESPVDIAYLVAGMGDTRAAGDKVEDPQLVLRAAQVNFAVPAAMAAALASQMAERGGGRIVLIGSAAGHHSLPFAASYAGSKAGLARFADALRIAVKPHGVSITLAAPGFIATPANPRRALDIPLDLAARRIALAAEKGSRHHVTPWPFAMLRIVDALLPASLRDRLLSSLNP